jgi:uncharacterized protein YjiS (DUF1127 family)
MQETRCPRDATSLSNRNKRPQRRYIQISHTSPSLMHRITTIHFSNVWRSRRALAALDDAALKDVGLTRHDATREAARPFWDAPNTWRM